MSVFINSGKQIFDDILKKYNMRFVIREERVFSLEGYGFSLDMIRENDGLAIDYVMPYSNEKVIKYNIDWYTGAKIDNIDRDNAGKNPDPSITGNAIHEMKIMASALDRHFSNILSGDKTWLKDFKNSKYATEPHIYPLKYR
jgi:hypothetical protein